jgi:hypothetical protein
MTTQSRETTDASTESKTTNADEHREHEGHATCHESVPPAVRETMLDEYSHKCQSCGRRGPEEGGLAELHVHHIERDPDGLDEHAEENLTVMCRPCHEWLHQQVDPTDAPVRITDEDRTVLLPQDVEILRVLADEGPARTGDVAAALTADLTVSAVRERLWVLMGLDNHVAERDRQLVDKDVETGEWGLTDQIETSARGHIPDDDQLLLQRMEDEQVRRALDRGSDRDIVMEVFGVSERSTFYKFKRACAFDFPLDAFSRGGRPSADEQNQEPGEASASDEADAQQRLDAVADAGDGDVEQAETWGSDSTGESVDADTTAVLSELVENGKRSESADDLHSEITSAIATLEDLQANLE